MRCVNTSSKWFKNLAEHYNVSSNQLEQITHKYWEETGSEEEFPTAVYIQAQLGKNPYVENSKVIRELWEKNYSKPQTFTNKEEYEAARQRASKVFPEEALVTYINNKDNFVLVVRKPIDKIKLSIKDYVKAEAVGEQEEKDFELIADKLADELEKNRNFAAATNLREQNNRRKENTRRLETTLTSIDSAAKSGEWTQESLNQLDNLVKNIKDGRIHFQRTVGERRSLAESISEIHEGASLILRASYGASEEKSRNPQEQFNEDAKQGKEQERVIEAWAKAADLWLNDYEDAEGNKANTLEDLLESQWKPFDQGSEADVRWYDDNTLIKSINLSHSNDNVAKALDGIALFNQQFPETALNIVGFGRDAFGHFRIIALQDFVEGQELTEEDYEEFLKKYKAKNSKYSKNRNKEVGITDLGHYNIIKDKNGLFHVVDADAFYKTPEKGGKVRFLNKLYVTDKATEEENNFDDLQMAIESRKKPHPFTFKDGTTIQAPFLVNQQQADALNAMNDFIHSNETSMTLSGYAGTGKTSLMEMLAQKMRREGKHIVFTATTNKAAAVLKSKVKKSGHEAHTLNSAFGLSVQVDANKDYDAKNLVTVEVDTDTIHRGDVVVIDEASMINEKNYGLLNAKAQEMGIKIIYVGDKAQLAPVNETQISKVFRNNEGRVIELTQVERTDDNAILKEATNLRNGKALSEESSFNEKGEGVAYIKASNQKAINDVIQHFTPGLRNNPDYFRILAYTNAAVSDYNTTVRNILGYTDNTPRVGEPIVGYSNWGRQYNRKTKKTTYKFINSEGYKVVSVSAPTQTSYIMNGQTYNMTAIPIVIEDAAGNRQGINFMDVKGDTANRQAATLLAKEKARLFNSMRNMSRMQKAAAMQEITAIENFLFINDNITEGSKTLQSKIFDFGYAMTVHKSQGSTFTNVLVDDVDINKASREVDMNNAVPLGLEAEAANYDYNNSEIVNTDEVDLGDFEVAPEPSKETAADVRQQLKYVAVSRATDTVTIISSDSSVKKEDSPLNHLPTGQDTASTETGTKPVQQMNSRELWEHIDSWMDSMGEKPIAYTPKGKTPQQYIVKDGKVYNQKGEEVQYIGKDLNKILAKLAIKEGRAVVVTNKDNKYIVDNHKNITSVATGKIMEWGEENGDRRAILKEAEQAFRNLIEERQQLGRELIPEIIEYFKVIYPDKVFGLAEMQKYLEKHGTKAIQQAIEEQKEMQAIKEQALKDGTFMKAPNGKPTNLTEKQWLQVRTKNFINWFGDWINDPANASKVIDENGEPLVVHNYSDIESSVYDKNVVKDTYSQAFWFSSNPKIYTSYGKVKKSVFLNIRNLDVITSEEYSKNRSGKYKKEGVQSRGFDGVEQVVKADRRILNRIFMAYEPAQVKSATDNNGEFSTENDDIQMYTTSNGEVYGFVDPKGNIYLDETVISPEHPIHEYTHLWDRLVAKNNPKLWKRGIDLMKQLSLWNEIAEDANYGQKWKAVDGMTATKMESLIASEVHSRIVGRQGEALLNRIAKEKGSKGIIGKLKQWILDFWKEVKATFSDWSQEEIDALTLDDFNKMVVRDLVDKVNLKEQQNTQQTTQQQSVPASYEGMITPDANTVFVFGSNPEGRHGAGAAKTAREKFGAIYGQGEGLQGNAYALPTKDLRVKENHSLKSISPAQITESIRKMYEVAKQNPSKQFKVAYTNGLNEATLNGYTGAEMIKMFKDAGPIPSNVVFSKNWTDHWNEVQSTQQPTQFEYARNANGKPNYEVSSRGDKRFSAMNASFAPGTTLFGHDVSGRTIESVYQHGVKQGDWTTDNNSKTGAPKDKTIITGNTENDSYTQGYLPLWQEWAKQNPQLIEELRQKAQGKVITDMFASTAVSQARALADILNSTINQNNNRSNNKIELGEAAKQDVKEKHFNKDQYNEAQAYQQSFLPEQQTAPETAPEQDQPFRYHLPEYEKYMPQDAVLDAWWKVPPLEELDSQLAEAETAEERNEILAKMNEILQAPIEDEYLYSQEVEGEKSNVTQKQEEFITTSLSAYDRLNTQIDNLSNSQVITPSEVRHVAELIMNAVSDEVTRIQKEEGYAKKIFPSLETSMDFQVASRKEIINTIGIQRLLDRQHDLFNTEVVEYDPLTGIKCDEIYDNWDGFLAFGRDFFALNEGFGIKMNINKNAYETTTGMHLGFESFNGYEDPDSLRELEGDDQEHWQVEQRTIDILNSASELVRMALHQCYQIDKKGNKVMSPYGIAERINPRKAVHSILSWTRGAQSLQAMIDKLSAKSESHPWLQQLINRLSDTSGNETDFQSQFFGTMCKSYQSYSIITKENGEYAAMPVNDHPTLSDTMQSIAAQQKMGEHQLFYANGNIKKEILGNEHTTAKDKEFNLHQALAALRVIRDSLNHNKELTDEMAKEASDNIYGVCRVFGFTPLEEVMEEVITRENILEMTKYLGFITDDLDKALKAQEENANNPKAEPYKPFAFNTEHSIGGTLRNFLTPITDIMDETVPNVVYDDGKLYQAFVTPSYMSLLMEKFKWEDKDFRDFIRKEYAESEWFKDTSKKLSDGWRNEWLRMLVNDEDTRKIFSHKVELNFNKHRYMRNMTDAEYTISLITHYLSEKADAKQDKVAAWFAVPMQSNKPSSEFIRFWAYRGNGYKNAIVDGLYKMFLQEVSRIQTVNMRNREKSDSDFIKNFDTNGKKFNFLPFLNDYLKASKKEGTLLDNAEENKKLAELLQNLESMQSIEGRETELERLVKKAIRNYNEVRVNNILNGWEANGILEAAKKIKGIDKKTDIREQLENYIWNQNYAAKNILQLTIGDIAMYKDAEDLQKRLAQLHAPGIRANITATDYKGNRVSDGIYRTIILKDFDSFKSNIIENIREVFDRKIAAAPESEKKALQAWRDALVGEDGAYTKINVTDAQGYSSPTSYRKKAFMFGRWSQKSEDIYNKLMEGEFNASDLETAFQPLKPFVYAQLHKDVGVEKSPIQKMPVPFQAKNSEFLLIMADALLRGQETSRPNLLRAIYRVMEYSERLNPTKGIDTVQFESAIKSGLQGKMNIHQFMNDPHGEEAAYAYMVENIYQKDADGYITKEYNTRTFVHEADYSTYCLQQEVPEHFKNHSQAHGSQERMIIPSDLDEYDFNGNDNYYEWTDPDGTKRREKSYIVRKEYEETIALNIDMSVQETKELFALDSNSYRERNIKLSEILQNEILDSPRYGTDLFQACSIDKETGEFRIPKGDPVQAKRIEQLINSIIKNRINKQTIAGGPIVQVSNFGTARQLHIRFNDKNGNLLMTKDEWDNNPAHSAHKTYKTYKDYIADNQAGIAYFEVFLPAWMNDLYRKFTDKDGNIDITTLELINPDLLKMISYRIPTEDKYSIAPMKAVGFMPKEAGSALMLPYELTEIDDSDFDIDKRYVMRKEIDIAFRVEPKAGETMTEAETSYIEHNRKSVVDHMIKAINLTGKTTKEERDAIIKDAESEAELEKRTAKRAHEDRLARIEHRNDVAQDAISDTKWSKDEKKDFDIYDKKAKRQENFYQKQLAKEEQRYQTELNKIEQRKEDTISKEIDRLASRKVREKIQEFLDIDRLMPAEQDDTLTRELRKAYLDFMFHSVEPTSGRIANNNKIIDMTWGILTNKMTADKILNPGGFEGPKNIAYKISAYRNQNGEIAWEDLDSKTTEDLKKISYADKDLTWPDTQIQFYKQNAAAASLIGVFAVNKVAHATLESNDILIAVDELCGEIPFKIVDTEFGGRMYIDPKYDSLGNLIGKTLGSMVSASADAVKDPILNLLNVNMTTAGILNTMLRLGMPFEDAVMFLSQNAITKILSEYNKKNLKGYTSLSSVIEERLDNYRKNNTITEDSTIDKESLTMEEMIQGLLDKEHDKIDYKVLQMFQKLKSLADAMRKPTFATRFNSISSAVGPLIVDNLIMEHKMQEFRLDPAKEKDKTGFYNSKGEIITIDDIFEEHPILKSFAKAVDIADAMFFDMPTGSWAFKNLLSKIPEGMKNTFYRDKKLMDSLSTFYQSYLLINSGMINPEELRYYIEKFPTEFVKGDFKKKYPDNALIQAINPIVSKKTGRTFLSVKITGEDEQQKEIYRSAWTELHRKNPELSKKLFTYCFFRGGIGFTPKTFTALLSNYVKEHLINGDASYIDTFRRLAEVPEELVIDQFIRNNWTESKLVPKKGGKGTHYSISGNRLTVKAENDLKDLADVEWMRVAHNNNTTDLWKRLENDKDGMVYEKVKPLGDNNEYVEMSNTYITTPMTDTKMDIEDLEVSELQTPSADETDAASNSGINHEQKAEAERKAAEWVDFYMEYRSKTSKPLNSKEEALAVRDTIKENPRKYVRHLQVAFKSIGLDLDEEAAIKKFNEMC